MKGGPLRITGSVVVGGLSVGQGKGSLKRLAELKLNPPRMIGGTASPPRSRRTRQLGSPQNTSTANDSVSLPESQLVSGFSSTVFRRKLSSGFTIQTSHKTKNFIYLEPRSSSTRCRSFLWFYKIWQIDCKNITSCDFLQIP